MQRQPVTDTASVTDNLVVLITVWIRTINGAICSSFPFPFPSYATVDISVKRSVNSFGGHLGRGYGSDSRA